MDEKNLRLRNYLPISGPGTREPVVGDEPDLRVSLGFCPRWYHQRLGVSFGARWHEDPIYRHDTLVHMKAHLHETFPNLPNFDSVLEDGVEKGCATISGVFGIKFIPMLYGLGVQYRADDWPDNLPGDHLDKRDLERLEPFDVATLPPMIGLQAQMDVLERTFGRIDGYMNTQGILNVALKLRGNEIFLDLYDDPAFVHHLFRHIAETISSAASLIQARQRKSGFSVDLLSMSNCVMNMVSPDQYAEFVLPYDRELSGRFARFGIHTCNWDVSPYLEVLRCIPKVGYLDMGMVSDMVRARELFPDARRAVLYPPVALSEKSLDGIREDLRTIYRDLAPCDVVMADVTESTPDRKVRDFIDLVEAVRTEGTGTEGGRP